jgi:hypothetical protein
MCDTASSQATDSGGAASFAFSPFLFGEGTPESLHRESLAQAAIANWNGWRLLVLIRHMDACSGYEHYGCATLAQYLELVCGITGTAARERIRVAFALEVLPQIEAAFARGEISYSKVRAVSRVATAETEDEWLEAARRRTAEELEVMAARSSRGQPLRRRLLTRPVNAHPTRMVVDLPAEEMALVVRALDRVRRAAGGSLAASDALVYLAADSLAGEVGEVKTAERYEVVVHVGADGASWVETDDAAGRAPIRPAVVERLLCDVALRVARDDQDGASVSRRARVVPELVRRSVMLRDGGRCRVPGCRRRLWFDLHHLIPVWQGGRSVRSNLVTLCRFHHQMVHEGFLRCERDEAGELRFVAVNADWVLGENGPLDDEELWARVEEVAEAAARDAWGDEEDVEGGEDEVDSAEAPATAGQDPEEVRSTYWRSRRRRAGQVHEPRAVYRAPRQAVNRAVNSAVNQVVNVPAGTFSRRPAHVPAGTFAGATGDVPRCGGPPGRVTSSPS